MPRTTIAEACRKRKIDRKDWDEAKRQGVDPWDQKAMIDWQSGRRHRLKPGATLPPESPEAKAQSLEEIEDAIKRASDIDAVKILKEKLAGIKIAVQVRAETRELVPVGEVRQSITRVVSAARAQLLKLSSDVPPKLAGLTEAEMQVIIREEITEILTRLSNETSELYAEV